MAGRFRFGTLVDECGSAIKTPNLQTALPNQGLTYFWDAHTPSFGLHADAIMVLIDGTL